MFAGRRDEIKAIRAILAQTRVGNAGHFLIFGERGIGKSSLMVAAAALAADSADGLPFLVVDVTLTKSDTEAVIASRIASKIQQKVGLKRLKDAPTALQEAWDFVRRLEVAGVKLNPSEQIVGALDVADKLVGALEKTTELLKDDFAGVVIVIDEADTAGIALGSLIKRTIDSLGKGTDRVSFGVAGLPELPNLMKQGHESSLRGFRHFLIEPLEPQERREVVDLGLAEARVSYGLDVRLDENASSIIAALSDGYPHFIQQFAYSAFDADDDMVISAEDVYAGAVSDGGALPSLGNAIFHTQFYSEVRSPNAREVLGALAASEMADSGCWISKAELRTMVDLKETTLTGCLKSLSDKHIILKDPERLGYYRVPSWGFAWWIRKTIDGAKRK